jgi:uncharacterized protein YndB with AHSA1/START domain
VTPNERVRYPWNGQFGDTTVEFTIRASDGGTELRLIHSGWSDESEESRQMHEQGWGFFVDNLDRYVTGGEDQRGAAMQQETASAGAATTAGP